MVLFGYADLPKYPTGTRLSKNAFRFWNKAFRHHRVLKQQERTDAENLDRLNAELAEAERREDENMQVLVV